MGRRRERGTAVREVVAAAATVGMIGKAVGIVIIRGWMTHVHERRCLDSDDFGVVRDLVACMSFKIKIKINVRLVFRDDS